MQQSSSSLNYELLENVPERSKEDGQMKGMKFSTNFTVFLLFFGVALLEAFQTRSWLKAAFWLAIGCVFLVSDNRNRAGTRSV
jgi:hypothetical protein